jgi:hypothetical protein
MGALDDDDDDDVTYINYKRGCSKIYTIFFHIDQPERHKYKKLSIPWSGIGGGPVGGCREVKGFLGQRL